MGIIIIHCTLEKELIEFKNAAKEMLYLNFQ